MVVSSRSLARALAERLRAVIPPPLTVRAEGEAVSLYAGQDLLVRSLSPAIVEDDDDRSPAQRTETAVWAVLEGIQDAAMDHLTEMWPRETDGSLAMAGTRLTSDRVYCWYGASEEHPAVRFEPIELG